jgi:hypothetical protein
MFGPSVLPSVVAGPMGKCIYAHPQIIVGLRVCVLQRARLTVTSYPLKPHGSNPVIQNIPVFLTSKDMFPGICRQSEVPMVMILSL